MEHFDPQYFLSIQVSCKMSSTQIYFTKNIKTIFLVVKFSAQYTFLTFRCAAAWFQHINIFYEQTGSKACCVEYCFFISAKNWMGNTLVLDAGFGPCKPRQTKAFVFGYKLALEPTKLDHSCGQVKSSLIIIANKKMRKLK